MEQLRNTIAADMGLDRKSVLLDTAASGASSKKYYRITGINNIAPGYKLLAMHAPQDTVSDYLDLTQVFAANRIRTPRIFYHNVAHGYLIMEDCGNITLEHMVQIASDADNESYYRNILDTLVLIQSCSPDPSSVAGSRYFDKEKFLYEYGFHICGKLIEGCLHYRLKDYEKKILDDFYFSLALELSEQPPVLVHRDFQSSNLIHMNSEWVIIDHQDARMGLALYDPVSLIEDVYVPLGPQLKQRLRLHYLSSARIKGLPVPADDLFTRLYDLTAIQRKLHDAGAFYFCFENFGNIKYLSYIKSVIQQALDVMSRYGEFTRPFEILTMISHAYLTEKQVR